MDRRRFLNVLVLGVGLGVGTVPALAGSTLSPAVDFSSSAAWIAGSMPSDFAEQVLAEGRETYSDLQQALTAIRDKRTLNLRLALSDARKKLGVVGTPPAERAVLGQLSIIENDLAAGTAPPDPTLWKTLEDELQALLADTPELGSKAREAIRSAKVALAGGDRAVARDQLAVLRSILEYRFDVFPLESVQEDVDSAWRAASLPDPLWEGVQQAVQSAAAQMRWLSWPASYGLLKAYFFAAHAALLLPSNEAEARQSLHQAAITLSEQPEAGSLTVTAETLTREKHLRTEDIGALIDGIRRHIHREQQHAMTG